MYCLAVIFKHWYCLHKNKKKEPVFSLIISWWTLNAVYILLIQNITEGKGLSSQISDFPELFYVFSFPILFQEWIIPLVVNPDNPQLCSQTHNLILPCWCCSWTLLKLTDHVFVMSKLCNTGKDWKQFSRGRSYPFRHVLTVVKGNILTNVS